jgi:hypothetical protein
MKQTLAAEPQNELGVAARNLLEAAFVRGDKDYSSGLAALGIQYVSETYASDLQASRALLSKVFAAERFEVHGHVEAPAVARQISAIKTVDPEFAITVYGEVFSHRITSHQTTRMSDSQIMPFMSNASQDYEMARYQLAHYFPELLRDSPLEATKVLIKAIDGFTGTEHAQQEQHGDWTFKIGGKDVHVTEDLSHI